jgi:Glycosyl transferase 4-like domain
VNRRLLLLSYGFPPAALPEAFLSAKRLGNMPGYDVDVICLQPGSDIRHDHSLDAYVLDRFRHVKRLRLPPLLRLLAGGSTSAVVQVPGLYHVVNRHAFQAALRLLQSASYDAMVTWSQWHSIHLVGLALKKRFPKLPWIAHFSDPWVDNPLSSYDFIRRAYDRHLERKVFESADVLSLTSRETVDLVFVESRAKYRCATVEIPHVFDPVLYPQEVMPHSGKLVFRSLGAFYGARSPEPLFKALALLRQRKPAVLDRIVVELIGSIPKHFLESQALQSLPRETVRVLPSVDYQTSLGLMRSADLLFNIDAPFVPSPFLPSKLVDYIGAERPIFGITPPGAASRVIGELGGWVCDPSRPDLIADKIMTAAQFIESNRGKQWGDAAAREQYSSALIGPRFSEIVDRAVAKAA